MLLVVVLLVLCNSKRHCTTLRKCAFKNTFPLPVGHLYDTESVRFYKLKNYRTKANKSQAWCVFRRDWAGRGCGPGTDRRRSVQIDSPYVCLRFVGLLKIQSASARYIIKPKKLYTIAVNILKFLLCLYLAHAVGSDERRD